MMIGILSAFRHWSLFYWISVTTMFYIYHHCVYIYGFLTMIIFYNMDGLFSSLGDIMVVQTCFSYAFLILCYNFPSFTLIILYSY